jgi:uncharacterized cupredoxin-like copper-binding protein
VSDIDGSEGPSPASALAFGVVFMAVFAAVALVAAFLVATPKTKVVAASAPTTTVADTTLPVTLAEFTITAPDTVTPGIKTLQITNAGMMQHELLVFRTDLSPSAYPIDPATGDLNEDGAGITKVSDGDNLDPGSTQSRSIDLSQPGTYSFVCNLPGHFRSGMVRTLTVAPTLPSGVITLTDFKVGTGSSHFTPSAYQFSIANGGPSQHELLVFRTNLAPADLPKNSDGSINENGPAVDKISDGDNIDPGGLQARTIDLTQPGSYVFVCNLPGHYANGMYTTVTVTAG